MASIASALAFGVCCTIVCQSAVSRIIYAMARDRQLPHLLARVHPKTKQPYVANIMVAAISLGIALWFQDHLAELFLFQNFGALCAFTLVNASLIMHYWVRSRSRRVLSHLIMSGYRRRHLPDPARLNAAGDPGARSGMDHAGDSVLRSHALRPRPQRCHPGLEKTGPRPACRNSGPSACRVLAAPGGSIGSRICGQRWLNRSG